MQFSTLICVVAAVAVGGANTAMRHMKEGAAVPAVSDIQAAAGLVAGAIPSEMLGHESWWIRDERVAACPGNPDAWDVYIVWGYPDATAPAGYVVTAREYAGETGYWCGGIDAGGDFWSSPYWSMCDAYFGYCQPACYIAGFTTGMIHCHLQPFEP